MQGWFQTAAIKTQSFEWMSTWTDHLWFFDL